MFRGLKFPLLYVLEAILLPFQAGGFLSLPRSLLLNLWLVSTFTTRPCRLAGKPLFLITVAITSVISDHPVLFALGILFLFLPTAVIYQVRKAQALQRQEAEASSNTAHAIAGAFVFATFIFTAYWLVFHLAAIVKPA